MGHGTLELSNVDTIPNQERVGENVRSTVKIASSKFKKDGDESTLIKLNNFSYEKEKTTVGMDIKDRHSLLPNKVIPLVQLHGPDGDMIKENIILPIELGEKGNPIMNPILNIPQEDVIDSLVSQRDKDVSDDDKQSGKG
mmetsp:Transcript_21247/g.29788  ORF Transcript_21247/g.29788 Transcript_21247/m.29788 type:complete len:140 (-) Transcript_21247:183-602(-)|eukprot:CAMPEP_0184868552 /NCGR_PEP_ID=MMETSP0580-20130426/30868_1 /TAXON_ID=1118495 /ORGANISM="Dactyliosolen fragilissimus" /LENGTH=139 /DNA_ID=CAMNT_0027369525 /DNA_START=406 /DNA_END=825 /DNA_ORIENTATION=+